MITAAHARVIRTASISADTLIISVVDVRSGSCLVVPVGNVWVTHTIMVSVSHIRVVRSLTVVIRVIVRPVVALSVIAGSAGIIISVITRAAIAKGVATVCTPISSSASFILMSASKSATTVMVNRTVANSARTANGLTTSKASVPYRTSAGIKAAVVMKASVAASVVVIYGRIAIIEMSYCIVGIDREVPSSGSPVYGANEVIGCQQ